MIPDFSSTFISTTKMNTNKTNEKMFLQKYPYTVVNVHGACEGNITPQSQAVGLRDEEEV